MIDIFIIAGETSGDNLGGELLQALYLQNPKLRIAGIGGPRMRAAGIDLFFPMEELQVMGFMDVFLALPRLISRFQKTVRAILQANPPVVVTIDYPGFNLRLARALKKKGFKGKICHYICPSVWAWGKSRIALMEKNLDLLLSVLPFEKSYFSHLRVEYIGHPLVDQITASSNHDPQLIAFFPGSRSHEIEKNFPYFLQLIQKLQLEFPHRCVVSLSQEKYRPRLLDMMQSAKIQLPLLLPEELKKIKPALAIAKSGTISLELALQEIPTVITYAISSFDTFVARYIFRISLPYYALPNLIADKEIFPELIGPSLTLETLYREVKNLIINPEAREKIIQDCHSLRSLLSSENASPKAAQLILSLPK